MRRSTVIESLNKETELVLDLFLGQAKRIKDLCLQF